MATPPNQKDTEVSGPEMLQWFTSYWHTLTWSEEGQIDSCFLLWRNNFNLFSPFEIVLWSLYSSCFFSENICTKSFKIHCIPEFKKISRFLQIAVGEWQLHLHLPIQIIVSVQLVSIFTLFCSKLNYSGFQTCIRCLVDERHSLIDHISH